MGNHLLAFKPSHCLTSHLGQLSLVISLWVGTMSSRERWDVMGTQHDALAPYRGFAAKAGVAEGYRTGDQHRRMHKV